MNDISSKGLLFTKRGQEWLAQFKPEDRETAEKLVNNLTLISHDEFFRAMQTLLEDLKNQNDAVAFFAAREVKPFGEYFERFYDSTSKKMNALNSGNDQGSEAIIASLIRNFCETNPDKFLNNPTLEEMRVKKCRSIIFIDDFIGTGQRIKTFISSFWLNRTIRSWHSRNYIQFTILAYTGTEKGIAAIKKHRVKPAVSIKRKCPSFLTIPWSTRSINKITQLCENYGRKTHKSCWFSFGYKKSMASIVFAHRCPNNAPAILWAEDNSTKTKWKALFPFRNVESAEKSVFPNEVLKPNPQELLEEIRQKKLAKSSALLRCGDAGEAVLIILALVAQGRRKKAALSFATGFDEDICAKILIKCIKWGFITPAYRITDKGHAELKAARKYKDKNKDLPDRGDDYYYPKKLRRITSG